MPPVDQSRRMHPLFRNHLVHKACFTLDASRVAVLRSSQGVFTQAGRRQNFLTLASKF